MCFMMRLYVLLLYWSMRFRRLLGCVNKLCLNTPPYRSFYAIFFQISSFKKSTSALTDIDIKPTKLLRPTIHPYHRSRFGDQRHSAQRKVSLFSPESRKNWGQTSFRTNVGEKNLHLPLCCAALHWYTLMSAAVWLVCRHSNISLTCMLGTN